MPYNENGDSIKKINTLTKLLTTSPALTNLTLVDRITIHTPLPLLANSPDALFYPTGLFSFCEPPTE